MFDKQFWINYSNQNSSMGQGIVESVSIANLSTAEKQRITTFEKSTWIPREGADVWDGP